MRVSPQVITVCAASVEADLCLSDGENDKENPAHTLIVSAHWVNREIQSFTY
jgi:hypothetical protein